MKKTICMIITIVMFVALTVNVYAEGTTNEKKECLFRGIPWGSNIETVIDSLEDINFVWDSPQMALGYLFGSTHIDEKTIGKYDDKGYNVGMKVIGEGSLIVAGHKVDTIVLYFAYLPNEDGKIDFMDDNTFFYRAEYLFDIKGNTMEGDNLLTKLQNLYGSNYKKSNQEYCDANWTVYEWYIGGDTMLVMEYDYDKIPVHVSYATKQGDDILYKAYKTQEKDARETMEKESEKYGNEGL